MAELRLSFFGAAGEVTGSMFLLEAAGARLLVDAGLFQGRRAPTVEKNRQVPVDPRRLDAVIATHAHIDHTGRLPLLVREGFHGPIYATPATRDLAAVMLPDSAHLQQKDAELLRRRGRPFAEPLYAMDDAYAVQELMIGLPYRRPLNLRRHVALEFTDAGHILGSASVALRVTEGTPHRIVFSGDIGRWGLPIIRDPQPPQGPVDTLVIESTYADRRHDTLVEAGERLGAVVRRVAARGGKVVVPAFAVGRTQEVVYVLHELHRAGRIPSVPVFIDSPLAVDATQVFRLHPDVFDARERLVADAASPFDFPLVHYVRSVEESMALNALRGPAVIIAASGMCEGGRVLHHLAHLVGDHRNCLLFVSFQAEHTLGRRLQDGAEVATVFGEEYPRRCEVETIGGYSAHADREELRRWVRGLGGPVRRAFCVHGEPAALAAMQALLLEEGVREVHVPAFGEAVVL